MTAAAGADEWSDLRNKLKTSSGAARSLDETCKAEADVLRRAFGINPGFSFYDDTDAPNAIAIPTSLVPNGPDGTVMVGSRLLQRLTSEGYQGTLCARVVMAHEFGHIVQFKERAKNSWEMEPHADFMAGWAIAQSGQDKTVLESAVRTMFEFGDKLVFTDPQHHGEPRLRAVMVRAGYDASTLDIRKAFEKGRVWANLERDPT